MGIRLSLTIATYNIIAVWTLVCLVQNRDADEALQDQAETARKRWKKD